MAVKTPHYQVALITRISMAATKAVNEVLAELAMPVAAASWEADGPFDVLVESPPVVSAIADAVPEGESTFDEMELDPSLAEPGRNGSILVAFAEEGEVLEPGSSEVDVSEELVAPLAEDSVLLEDGDVELDAEELEPLGSIVLPFAPIPENYMSDNIHQEWETLFLHTDAVFVHIVYRVDIFQESVTEQPSIIVNSR